GRCAAAGGVSAQGLQDVSFKQAQHPGFKLFDERSLECDSSGLSDSDGGRIMVPEGGPSDGRKS
ncbi:MAG: hypothetical protein KF847_20850, partial [Pirellulales bacterium]|nr:hypothetical protein [Pirellulales bacterium]